MDEITIRIRVNTGEGVIVDVIDEDGAYLASSVIEDISDDPARANARVADEVRALYMEAMTF